jgi:hypothetical protein
MGAVTVEVGSSEGATKEQLGLIVGALGALKRGDRGAHPRSETARVIGAVARGDLSQTMALEVDGRPLEGEFLRIAKTINKMVDQLGSFASEVTRVAREVGAEGILGGQGYVRGVSGTWKDLTDSVNFMAGNLTSQVRGIAKVVTTVAREEGVGGKLGGQAKVPRAAGTWKLEENGMRIATADNGLPIMAVTAKAMKGDRDRRIEAGAWDYLAKPVDTGQMLAVLRSWLHR